MTETEKQRRGQIWLSLGWSFGLSIPFSLVFHDARISPLLMALIFGLPFGLFMGTIGQNVIPRIHHPSFVVTLLGRTLAYSVGFLCLFVGSLSIYIAITNQVPVTSPEVWQATFRVIGSPSLLISFAISLTLLFTIRGIHEVSRKLGPGNLWNWISGKYHSPREEERIFMFLDLRGSTTLAEQLGNLKFSALVRDFFIDLTQPVVETLGEVSHYIGDEAVLTWRMERGIKHANCVRCFFLMEDRLASRSNYYRDKYGLVPTFKAGLHSGLVVATEVGVLKSEIVFHGDVLNTAARIQGLCDKLAAPLLLSGEVAQQLNLTPYLSVDAGSHELKGKELPVHLVSVRRP